MSETNQTTRRRKVKASATMHAGRCSICKHSRRAEIESAYSAFESIERVSETFGVSKSAVWRHAEFAGLDVKRVSDMKKVLGLIIARGLSQLKNVDARLLISAIKELNRITGCHIAPEQNPADRLREEDNRKWAGEQLEQLMSETGISRDEAMQLVRENAPTLFKWLM